MVRDVFIKLIFCFLFVFVFHSSSFAEKCKKCGYETGNSRFINRYCVNCGSEILSKDQVKQLKLMLRSEKEKAVDFSKKHQEADNLFFRQEKFDEAITLAESGFFWSKYKFGKFNDDASSFASLLSRFYSYLKFYQKALEYNIYQVKFYEFLESNTSRHLSNLEDAQERLAENYSALQNYSKANELYEKILKFRHSSDFFNRYGNFLIKYKKYAEAERYFYKSIDKTKKGKRKYKSNHPHIAESLKGLKKLYTILNNKKKLDEINKKLISFSQNTL